MFATLVAAVALTACAAVHGGTPRAVADWGAAGALLGVVHAGPWVDGPVADDEGGRPPGAGSPGSNPNGPPP